MARAYSQSQGQFIDVPDTGTATPAAGGQLGGLPTADMGTYGGAPGVGGQPAAPSQGSGLDLNSIYKLLGVASIKQGKYGQAATILSKTTGSAKDQEKAMQLAQAGKFTTQLDGLMKDWDKIPMWARLPLPGLSRISPERARFDTAKELFNVQLILMWEDKRITDDQRRIFASLFPDPLMTKKSAQERINTIKDVVTQYNSIVSPYKQQQQSTNLEDIMSLTGQ